MRINIYDTDLTPSSTYNQALKTQQLEQNPIFITE